MTPYEYGYTQALEKLARGMFPNIKQLFRMGVKPGSGVSLLPYARQAARGAPIAQEATRVGKALGMRGAPEATAVGRRMMGTRPTLLPHEVTGDTLLRQTPAQQALLPRRMMPDVREILRQRAQQAGTYRAL